MNEAAQLRSRVLNAVAWATATRMLGQLLNWAMTLAVIRFLQPSDYGLMALTTVVLGLFQSLSYVGLSDALVQSDHVSDEELRSVFGLILLINGGIVVVVCALAYPIAAFYHEPRLVPLLHAASLIFAFLAFMAIPRSRLEKALDLKRISRVEIISNLVGGGTVLGLALLGLGVWSLLLGMLAGTAFRMLGFQFLSPCLLYPAFRFQTVSRIATFGGIRMIEQLAWVIYASADVFIIGRLLSPSELGEYSVARSLAELPIDKLSQVIKPVAFPAFALVQKDRTEALRYLLKAMRILGLTGFPVFFGISAIAPELGKILLGEQWLSVVQPLEILAIAMALRTVGLILPSFLQGIGQPRASLNNTLFGLILLPIAFAIGCHWGVIGVSISWLLAYPLQFYKMVRQIARILRAPVTYLIRPVVEPFFASVGMYLALAALREIIPRDQDPKMNAIILVIVGIACYVTAVVTFARPLVGEVVALVRR